MEIIYSEVALKDLEHWKKSGDKAIEQKIKQLVAAIEQSPFDGIVKPEP